MSIPQRLAEWACEARLRAAAEGIDPLLVLAVIDQESSGRQYAYNPEPKYRYLVDYATRRPFRHLTPEENSSEIPPPDFTHPAEVDRDAEWWGQQASWGLMQLMGAVAREGGFRGPDFPGLTHPSVNLGIGIPFLAGLLRRFPSPDGRQGLAAYNAGPGGRDGAQGQQYATEVLERYALLTGSELT